MKQVSFFSIVIFIVLFIFSSCSKSSDPLPTDPGYVGFWKGKYSNSATSYPTSGYSFIFRNDGTVRVFDGSDTATAGKAEGTYSITGALVNCTYTYVGTSSKFSTAANIDPKNTFQEGSWGSGTNTTNGGKYFIIKQ